MQALGLPVSIAGVAQAYRDFLDMMIVDNRDAAAAEQLRATGFHVQCTKTIMKTAQDKADLARTVVSLVSGASATPASTD
jgi:LPPG:FO 2-phospho-L-lactate transferase